MTVHYAGAFSIFYIETSLKILGFLFKDQQDVTPPQVKRCSPGRSEYLMVLQVSLCIGPHVSYFLSCVF